MALRKAHVADLRERAVAMVFELRAETWNPVTNSTVDLLLTMNAGFV